MKQVEFMYLLTLVGLLCPQGRLVKQVCVLGWINLKRKLGLFSKTCSRKHFHLEKYLVTGPMWNSLK